MTPSSPEPSSPRIGVVPYLNMLPFTHGLEALRGAGGERLVIVSVPPSRMTDLMARGELDLGMIPTGGLIEHPAWRIVGRSMIGSEGPVWSVLVFGLGEPSTWVRLRPDSHSRTSNYLARMILARRSGFLPRLEAPIPSDGWRLPADPKSAEAFVLIGARALKNRSGWEALGGTVMDLGQAWEEWTGLPFVYAVWVARPDVELGDWPDRLDDLKRRNLERLDQLAAAWPGLAEEGLTPGQALQYLRERIRFDLTPRALQGLKRFHDEGLALRLFDEGWDMSASLGTALEEHRAGGQSGV